MQELGTVFAVCYFSMRAPRQTSHLTVVDATADFLGGSGREQRKTISVGCQNVFGDHAKGNHCATQGSVGTLG
jgi:hypothetical protein